MKTTKDKKGEKMAARHDYTRELCVRYDETTRKLREIAKKRNIDLSKIGFKMKETDHPRKYLFYN